MAGDKTAVSNGARAVDKLPFTTSELLKAIPKECFEKNLGLSVYYMLRDFVFIACMYALYPHANTLPLKFIWWNVTGFLGWCLFVVGHDCGHGTFSESNLINQICGHICHAPILVPFNGWRISHYHHHRNHNHIENDHSWRPVNYSYFKSLPSQYQYLLTSSFKLLLFPYYLLADSPLTSGNHFNPWSRLFNDQERVQAGVSALSVVAFLGFLFTQFSFTTLLDAYFVPYMIFTVWLSLVTYLHHTDERSTYYRSPEWTYLLGALSTIDRSYGWIIDHLHHDIGTHVVHHIFFTKIPHYHLRKANKALVPILGDYYMKDDTFFLKAFANSVQKCVIVDDDSVITKYSPTVEGAAPAASKKRSRSKKAD